MAESYVYLIESTSGHFKIGKSNDPERRLAQLQRTRGPFEYRLILKVPFESEEEAVEFERLCHDEYRYQHVRGEWFKLTAKDLVEWGAVGEMYLQNYNLATKGTVYG